jgi:hypothetical protein
LVPPEFADVSRIILLIFRILRVGRALVAAQTMPPGQEAAVDLRAVGRRAEEATFVYKAVFRLAFLVLEIRASGEGYQGRGQAASTSGKDGGELGNVEA